MDIDHIMEAIYGLLIEIWSYSRKVHAYVHFALILYHHGNEIYAENIDLWGLTRAIGP